MFIQCSWLKGLLIPYCYKSGFIKLNKMIFNIYKNVMFLETEKNNSRLNAFILGQAKAYKIVAKSVMKWCLEL